MYFKGYCTLFFNMDGKVLEEMRRGLLGAGETFPISGIALYLACEYPFDSQVAIGCRILTAFFPKDSYPSPRGWSRTNFFEENLEWDWGETRIL
jgi:hypothetical protein